jgi:hypothetical protein
LLHNNIVTIIFLTPRANMLIPILNCYLPEN